VACFLDTVGENLTSEQWEEPCTMKAGPGYWPV